MGETEATPLSLMLSQFSGIRKRARILSIDIWRKRFQIYCISEWPTFDVGWPQEGTFHLPIILQVKTVILTDKLDGHSDQVPYILICQDMMENPPPWLKPFLPPKAGPTENLALQKAKKEMDPMPEAPLHPVFQDSSPKDLILPPPYWASLPASAPPLESTGGCKRGATPP
ncbi:Gag polyprotein [Vulpes lagopus]